MKGLHFQADWSHVVFIHFRMTPKALDDQIPFDLDLRDGDALVSLVAFTLAKMRLNVFPNLSRVLLRPFSEHEFLNVRTYVRHGKAPGIYFLAEWLNRPAAVPFGGFSYRLPYRKGKIEYQHRDDFSLSGSVREGTKSLTYAGESEAPVETDEFLLERYVAFTSWRGCRRSFEIEHAPWMAKRASILMSESSLLEETGHWIDEAEPAGAHYSEGMRDVAMGFPNFLS